MAPEASRTISANPAPRAERPPARAPVRLPVASGSLRATPAGSAAAAGCSLCGTARRSPGSRRTESSGARLARGCGPPAKPPNRSRRYFARSPDRRVVSPVLDLSRQARRPGPARDRRPRRTLQAGRRDRRSGGACGHRPAHRQDRVQRPVRGSPAQQASAPARPFRRRGRQSRPRVPGRYRRVAVRRKSGLATGRACFQHILSILGKSGKP